MTKTSPQIVFVLGTAILLSASSTDAHPISTIDNLVSGEAVRSLNYATYEPNGWLLDGSKKIYDQPQNVGFVSDVISDGTGAFATAPEIRLTLDAAADIEQGITLKFSNLLSEWCDDVDISYKNAADALIATEAHMPNGYNYFCPVTATRSAVKYIDIAFNSTNIVSRHVRLLNVYVDGVLFDESEIKSASIIDEIDQSSLTLPASTLDFSLYSANADFSIVDPQGVYALLRKGMPIDSYELVDGARDYLGRFYIEDWNSKSENLADFQCVDALAMLNSETTYGNDFVAASNWTAEQAMSAIMGDVFVSGLPASSPYGFSIDASLADKPVLGWLPIMNRREALQQLALSIGGYVTCSRSNQVEIRPLQPTDEISTWDWLLTDADISNPDVKKRNQVTGIRIVAHTFTDKDPIIGDPVIFDDFVEIGELIVYPPPETDVLGLVFSDPTNYDSTAEADGGFGSSTLFLCGSNSNFATCDILKAGRLVLIDYKVNVHNRKEYLFELPNVPAGTPENIITIENATLINNDNVAEVGARLLAYFENKYTYDTKVFAKNVAISDAVKIDTQASKQISGVVERADINLTGGYTQVLKTVGDIVPVSRDWYSIQYLLLGGGGAGASGASTLAGGGGAGEIVFGADIVSVGDVFNIVVGAGGPGGINTNGGDGSNTTYNGKTAHGGGGGGRGSTTATAAQAGRAGGNGGGGGGNNSGVGADGTGGAGYRFDGGQGSNGASNYGGGGGGGNNQIGYSGASGAGSPCQGGAGLTSSITGASITYGGGGGGIGIVNTGAGGAGGGGAGNRTGAGTAGTNGLGGGGGASPAGTAGANGGSGVAILKIKTSKYTGTTTGSLTVSVDGDYTVLKYTGNGSYTA